MGITLIFFAHIFFLPPLPSRSISLTLIHSAVLFAYANVGLTQPTANPET